MNSPKVLVVKWKKAFSKEFYIILAVIVTIAIIILFLRRRTKHPTLPPICDQLTAGIFSFFVWGTLSSL